MSWRFVLLLIPALLAAETLEEKIAAAAKSSFVAKHAFWGVHAVNLATGQPIYSHDAERTFVPASNTKLFATALALTRLGPTHQFETRLVADGLIDPSGTLRGNLRLIGGGDPTLSGRPVPYHPAAKFSDPIRPLEVMVDEVVAAGVRRVTGDVIGDDTAYLWEPYPPGWAQDDLLEEYGAPVSALILHDNAVRVEVRPGPKDGDRAEVELRPANSYLAIESHVVTGPETRVQAGRGDHPRLITLWGSVRLGDGLARPVAIPDPAHYAAYVLKDALERRGVRVDGGTKARHRYSWMATEPADQPLLPKTLTKRLSPPLSDLLKVVNKVSQNLHAEIMLREIASGAGFGARRAALAEMARFLRLIGVPENQVNLVDGSGLSRLTLASPTALTTLLRWMYNSPNREVWLDTLPIGGEDGTLSSRFRGLEGIRIRAKTGTLTHVSALSGYIDNSRGETIAFSVMVNNVNGTAGTARLWIDEIVKLLAE
jgi:D-alanyl-D-alanine carboxypeptidase/D-alanyl-D-alanine-endopeptidase (penicillin-binding protein 4)